MNIIAVQGIPEIRSGDRLAEIIGKHGELATGDVVVVASKIVAKSEGRVVACPSDREAKHRLIESTAKRILRRRGDLLITETHHGFVCANAGIDWSNVEPGHALLLPVDPDRSARRIRDGLRADLGIDVAVIVSDTFGRTWRNGVTDVAIGCAGIRPVLDLRGHTDGYGNVLKVTQVCVADQLAGAAELVMGKTLAIPVAIVRGVDAGWFGEGSITADVIRHPNSDLFR